MPTITPSVYVSLALALMLVCLQLFGAAVFSALALEPSLVEAGEIWRILSGHFVHFSMTHMLMNSAALLLITALLLDHLAPRTYGLLIVLQCAVIGALLSGLHPEYSPYAGFSGELHALLVFGILASPHYARAIKALALAAVAAKIGYELSPLYNPSDLKDTIGADVAVHAHLYGALTGMLSFIGYRAATHYRPSSQEFSQ